MRLNVVFVSLVLLVQVCQGFIGIFSYFKVNSVQQPYYDCPKVPGLTPNQIKICKNHPHAFKQILISLTEAKTECLKQFQGQQWNCRNYGESVYGFDVSKLPIKQSSFIYSLTAATAALKIAKSCSSGMNPACNCGDLPINENNMEQKHGFNWAGCSDNTRYADDIVRAFFEKSEKFLESNNNGMNIHNLRVGRTAARKSLKMKCKCHGISGSCTTKTCWMAVEKLDVISKALATKMEKAKLVKKKSNGQLEIGKKEFKDQLVFTDTFNNFCVRNQTLGITGVKDRECGSEQECGKMCCGRGWKVSLDLVKEQCNCRVIYCCEVKCDLCSKIKERSNKIALIVGIVSIYVAVLYSIYLHFPALTPEDKVNLKYPRTIENAKNLGIVLSKYTDHHYYNVLSAVVGIYIVLQSFAIPGSLFLTILSGYLFKFYHACILVCMCSAIGATVCYFLSQWVAREALIYYCPDKIKTWQREIDKHQKNMFNYIFFLRVTPILPNWFINMSSPILNVPLKPFFLGTLFGVAPPSFVFIQAGQTLNMMTDTNHMWSWNSIGLLSFFAILSLAPVVWNRYKTKSH
uniref:Protein Wnt n=1 Tax=Rhabditophanes sp. KR3021 TaxID=114890 RepID=A0AC35THY1_9BILA